MENRPDNIAPDAKQHYNPRFAAYCLAYVSSYPEIARSIAREYGWQDSGDQGCNDWYLNLMHQYYLADLPPSKKSGAKDARIWLKTAMHGLDTTTKMLDKFQREVELILLRKNGEVVRA